jgi:hypothetical protein
VAPGPGISIRSAVDHSPPAVPPDAIPGLLPQGDESHRVLATICGEWVLPASLLSHSREVPPEKGAHSPEREKPAGKEPLAKEPQMLSHKVPSPDRRREDRVKRTITLMVRRQLDVGRLAQAVDLSANGIRFHHLGSSVLEGEKVLVQFMLRGKTFSFCGRVVRMEWLGSFAQDVALAFVGMDAKTRVRLKESLLSTSHSGM